MAPATEVQSNRSALGAWLIIRQPILDRDSNLFAYDLRFHGDADVVCMDGEPEQAWEWLTQPSADPSDLFQLAGDEKIILPIPSSYLLAGAYRALPPERTILELIDGSPSDPNLVAACKQLIDEGYGLALNAKLCDADETNDLAPLAGLVCLEYGRLSSQDVTSKTRAVGGDNTEVLFRKLATQDAFAKASGMGADYFHGSFFYKPEITKSFQITEIRQHYLKFIEQVNQPEIDFAALEQTVMHDASLSLRLLKLVNSAAFGLPQEVKSIKHALILLGEKPLRQWAAVAAMSELGSDQPAELIKLGLFRARFCELLGREVSLGDHAFDLFYTGLLSILDVLTHCTMAEALQHVPVADASGPLADVYALVRAYEETDFTRMTQLAGQMSIPMSRLTAAYGQATKFADECVAA